MNYQPFLIAGFATGLDREVQPWMLPNDAFTDLLDGFVYRGVLNKRDGYEGFATGIKSTPTESRMVHKITAAAMVGLINSSNQIFTLAATPPLRRGTFTITGTTPSQIFADNGLRYFLKPAINISGVSLTNPAGITTAVNHGYTTGDQVVISSVGGTTELNSTVAYTITVMALNTFTLNAVDATGFTAYTSGGTSSKVVGNINYTTGAVSITLPLAPTTGTVTATYSYFPGLPVMGIMNFYPATNVREMIVADTTYVNKYDPATDTLMDITPAMVSYHGVRTDFWSWVNYANATSVPRLLFANGNVADVIQQWNGTVVTDYVYTMDGAGGPVTTLNARQIFAFKGRLILFQTTENGTLFPRRIRISGFGADVDDFRTSSPGAGTIDIPDTTWFFGAAFNRDDILFYTETSTWALKYTGNDVKPFTLQKIDGSRGSAAAFSVISYLNQTIAASPRGLIVCDGYQVDRTDNNIPDFTFENIDNTQANFQECFSGFVDQDRDVYMLYPSKGTVKLSNIPVGSSDQILVINFEEDNFAIYRTPLSCMGEFQVTQALLWSDLTAANGFPTWDALAAKYATWGDFPFTKGSPIPIGGGHKGEIWELNADGSEDNPLHIRNITISGIQLVVTTDWNNYNIGDYIAFTDVQGMTGINGRQGFIDAQTDYYTFTVTMPDPLSGSYVTNSGMASRVVPFEAISKKLNPYINIDKKLMCGWVYFYVSVTNTSLVGTDGTTPLPALLKVDVLTNNNEGTDFSKPTFSYLVDCSAINNELGGKKWVKIWINQVGQFLQFKYSNTQAGTRIQVHATMFGLMPTGRLI